MALYQPHTITIINFTHKSFKGPSRQHINHNYNLYVVVGYHYQFFDTRTQITKHYQLFLRTHMCREKQIETENNLHNIIKDEQSASWPLATSDNFSIWNLLISDEYSKRIALFYRFGFVTSLEQLMKMNIILTLYETSCAINELLQAVINIPLLLFAADIRERFLLSLLLLCLFGVEYKRRNELIKGSLIYPHIFVFPL